MQGHNWPCFVCFAVEQWGWGRVERSADTGQHGLPNQQLPPHHGLHAIHPQLRQQLWLPAPRLGTGWSDGGLFWRPRRYTVTCRKYYVILFPLVWYPSFCRCVFLCYKCSQILQTPTPSLLFIYPFPLYIVLYIISILAPWVHTHSQSYIVTNVFSSPLFFIPCFEKQDIKNESHGLCK